MRIPRTICIPCQRMRLFPAQPPPNRLQISARPCGVHTNTDELRRHVRSVLFARAKKDSEQGSDRRLSGRGSGVRANPARYLGCHINEKLTFRPDGHENAMTNSSNGRTETLWMNLRYCDQLSLRQDRAKPTLLQTSPKYGPSHRGDCGLLPRASEESSVLVRFCVDRIHLRVAVGVNF